MVLVCYYPNCAATAQPPRAHTNAGSHCRSTTSPVSQAVPVAAAQPVVAAQAVVPVVGAAVAAVPQDNLWMLQNMSKLVINQHINVLEAVTQGCVEQANIYSVFNAETGQKVFHVVEESDDCSRCCCKPMHSLALIFHAVNPDGSPGPIVLTLERKGTTCNDPFSKCLCCWNCDDMCADGFRLHAGHVSGPDHQADALSSGRSTRRGSRRSHQARY